MWEDSNKKRESNYSGRAGDDIVTGHENYNVKPGWYPRERRRHPRIPCRNVKACIRTPHATSVIVDVQNMSRCGVFFTTVQHFSPGTSLSIAVHYMEGGQNMFQNCRIVRAHPIEAGSNRRGFAAEFSII